MRCHLSGLNVCRGLAIVVVSGVLAACGGSSSAAPEAAPKDGEGLPHQLAGWAALPDTARWPGPVTGQFTAAVLGVTPPFASGVPIPGFSALLRNDDGSWTAMADNGYGAKGNSADFVLGLYNASINFRTAADASKAPGSIKLNSFLAFNDAKGFLNDGKGVDLKITADYVNYPSNTTGGLVFADSGIAVDARIRAGRLLTGFDFDIESLARAADGTYFVGEEFGPYILHFDKNGTLMGDPVPHPFLRSPANPEVLGKGASITLSGSRGFESLAYNADRSLLYAVPEAAPSDPSLRPVAADERYLNIFEFDPGTMRYTGKNLVYRKDGAVKDNGVVIGDMTNVGGSKFVLIERDGFWGAKAVIKRLYLVDLKEKDADGALKKTLLVDLLNISDPNGIGGQASNMPVGKFSMPFDSVESVEVLDAQTLVVAIDTNYPGEDGRKPGKPDDTEVITLRFDKAMFDRSAK